MKAIKDLRAQDERALRNGGPGYGDWRDDRDREEMAEDAARRELGQADDD